MRILITGGAGFIGSHIADRLINDGHSVRIYDSLEPQVHPNGKPAYINRHAEFIQGDICDEHALDAALRGIDVIFHKAAMVGVGQSMFLPRKYTYTNTLGAATLLDVLVNRHRDHVQKVVVAASMSEYGEGLYECPQHGVLKPELRSEEQLARRRWEIECPQCQCPLKPVATPETAPLACNSIYALNKRDHEDYFLLIGRTFGIPTVALRYFNVYGTRQSLSNPYTGVAAIFISRLKASHNPIIFEDGNQSRDFVAVEDVVEANIAVMNDRRADFGVFNVGSGTPITISDLARLIIELYGSTALPEITNEYRKGDIRHCYGDISKIKQTIGWAPAADRRERLERLIEWSESAESRDSFGEATATLKEKGII